MAWTKTETNDLKVLGNLSVRGADLATFINRTFAAKGLGARNRAARLDQLDAVTERPDWVDVERRRKVNAIPKNLLIRR
jgi:hypothetical protein